MSFKHIALAVLSAAVMVPAMAQQAPNAETLKRAEVLADLQLWHEAGMQHVAAEIDIGQGQNTAEYRKYVELRNGPRFAQAVQAQLGNTALAGQPSAAQAAE